jgi:hypothetical protein
MTQLYTTIDPEVKELIIQKCINRRRISWLWLESICFSYDDLFFYVSVIIRVDGEFSGFPSEKSRKKLLEFGIKT